MKLKEYRKKRDFSATPEPSGRTRKNRARRRPIFVIQEHHARRLHFDFRLELKGVLKSWAITREPLDQPQSRALAIETEDHPLEYASFHGTIPAGHYGAGKVKIWDHGVFEAEGDLARGIEGGKVVVILRGRRLHSRFALIRVRGEGTRSQWLFFKTKPKIVGLRI